MIIQDNFLKVTLRGKFHLCCNNVLSYRYCKLFQFKPKFPKYSSFFRNLSKNTLSGEIPSFLGQCTQLTAL
jgi:hypothetical protein